MVSLLAVEDLRRRSAGEVLPRGPAERTAVRTRLIPGDVLREHFCVRPIVRAAVPSAEKKLGPGRKLPRGMGGAACTVPVLLEMAMLKL